MDKLGEMRELLARAEQGLREDMSKAFGSAEDQWARVSAMAGLSPEGAVIPAVRPITGMNDNSIASPND